VTGVRTGSYRVFVGGVVAVLVAACSTPNEDPLAPPPAPAGPQIVYVAVGASETAGVGSDQPLREAWPQVLFRTALPPSSVFVNLGIPGATVATALREELPQAIELAPALVTVWLNVNDLLAGVAPADFERDLGTLVRGVRRGGSTRVLVANVPPLDQLPAYLACRPSPPAGRGPCELERAVPGPDALNRAVDAYNAATERVTTREGALLVDLHEVGLAARRSGTEASLVSADGFHPSTAGHAAVAAAFSDVLARSGPLG
jgi:acyl-CoA thioesterase-1